jgi:hypothetical protein
MIQMTGEILVGGIESADGNSSGHSGPHDWQMLGHR